jgi:hypothetical protein
MQGWNMIGSISYPVASIDIASNTAGLVLSQLWGYARGYFATDSIRPGFGYWVKANKDGQIILAASLGPRATNRVRVLTISELPPSPPGEIELTVPEMPKCYSLDQNYPNPFNPITTMKYELPSESMVRLIIYNTLGQVVGILADGVEPAGFREIEWNASSVSSGVYFYRLDATSVSDPGKTFSKVMKMILMK